MVSSFIFQDHTNSPPEITKSSTTESQEQVRQMKEVKQQKYISKAIHYQCSPIKFAYRLLFQFTSFNKINFCQRSLLQCKVNTIPILMHQMHSSTNEVSSVVLGSKKLEVRKKNEKSVKSRKARYCAMKLSQIRRRIELCMREIILRKQFYSCLFESTL